MELQSHRLVSGGTVDRTRLLHFTCNGRRLTGYAGDTLASALIANGVRVVGRSFKYHRPRGLLAAGIEEPNAIFRVDANGTSRTLVRATEEPLVEGLAARSENAFPSVGFDLGRILDFTHALWPAGFYNKTFTWPNWHWYEGLIRRSAGLGQLPAGADPGRYFQHNLHCDVLVVGAGPAGLAAALAAGRAGAKVVLAEQGGTIGGALLHEPATIDGRPAGEWRSRAVAELSSLANVRLLTRTVVTGHYGHRVFVALDRSDAAGREPVERLWKIRPREAVITTGAYEQPLVFPNNDRPGILLAGAARRYVTEFAATPGRAVVVATNNDDAYRTALVLHAAGIKVPAIVDSRAEPSGALPRAAAAAGLLILANASIVDAAGTRGVTRVVVRSRESPGRWSGRARRIACDAVAVSGGWSPAVHLFSQAGGTLRYREELACFVPAGTTAGVHVAGAANGAFSIREALAEGHAAGVAAAAAVGAVTPCPPAPTAAAAAPDPIDPASRLPAVPGRRQWIDLRHDVTSADIELAIRENFTSVEHVKRYTTTGMAIDQGKTSNLNALALVAELTGRPLAEIGTTTYRPMVTPISMGALAGGAAGALYSPARRLPLHDWHTAHGADLEDYGAWRRPACYRSRGEARETAIAREVLAVRRGAGLFDGSPLGKIEVRGPDTGEFLHRLYVNNALTLAPGKVRYGIMLNENGIVLDDGVFARLAPDHYLVSTTSANAERITGWFDEWHQCEWPELRVVIVPVTSQWAVLTLAGPAARGMLAALDGDLDFAPAAFPHMTIRTGQIDGEPARVQRVSFSGEVSFEVSVPARRAAALWHRLIAAGAVPVGVEAILVLRLEKGFLHVGTDTDGTTNALDIGLGAIVAKKPTDFVGRRSLLRPADQRTDRRQLVGLEALTTGATLVPGAQLVRISGTTRRSQGFVTSACLSPTLGRHVGLGLLEGGHSRPGEVITAFDNGKTLLVRVVSPLFYDPTGERMHG